MSHDFSSKPSESTEPPSLTAVTAPTPAAAAAGLPLPAAATAAKATARPPTTKAASGPGVSKADGGPMTTSNDRPADAGQALDGVPTTWAAGAGGAAARRPTMGRGMSFRESIHFLYDRHRSINKNYDSGVGLNLILIILFHAMALYGIIFIILRDPSVGTETQIHDISSLLGWDTFMVYFFIMACLSAFVGSSIDSIIRPKGLILTYSQVDPMGSHYLIRIRLILSFLIIIDAALLTACFSYLIFYYNFEAPGLLAIRTFLTISGVLMFSKGRDAMYNHIRHPLAPLADYGQLDNKRGLSSLLVRLGFYVLGYLFIMGGPVWMTFLLLLVLIISPTIIWQWVLQADWHFRKDSFYSSAVDIQMNRLSTFEKTKVDTSPTGIRFNDGEGIEAVNSMLRMLHRKNLPSSLGTLLFIAFIIWVFWELLLGIDDRFLIFIVVGSMLMFITPTISSVEEEFYSQLKELPLEQRQVFFRVFGEVFKISIIIWFITTLFLTLVVLIIDPEPVTLGYVWFFHLFLIIAAMVIDFHSTLSPSIGDSKRSLALLTGNIVFFLFLISLPGSSENDIAVIDFWVSRPFIWPSLILVNLPIIAVLARQLPSRWENWEP